MIDRLTEKWVAYTCSEKGEGATDKEDVRFLLSILADELEAKQRERLKTFPSTHGESGRNGWINGQKNQTDWIRSESKG